MNATVSSETTALATLDRVPTGRDLILHPENLNAMMRVADMMAKSRNMVPKHLRDNPGGCLAVTMQSMRWNMDPFALAVKTYTVNADGPVAYEGQAIIAALNNSPLLANRLNFEWFGEWHKIVGKFKTVESKTKKDDDGFFKKYIVPAWDIADEQGLGVRVWATLVGEKEPRKLELLMTQVRTRNSGLWTEDPQQQIGYLSGRRWGRLHAPDVIMGVYTPDELMQPEERFMGMVDEVTPAGRSDTNAKAETKADPYPEDDFAKNLATWRKVIKKGKTPDEVIATVNSLGKPLSDDQCARIKAIPAELLKEAGTREGERTGPITDAPAATYDQVKAKLEAAANLDALNEAATLIAAVAGLELQAELNTMFDTRAEALNG